MELFLFIEAKENKKRNNKIRKNPNKEKILLNQLQSILGIKSENLLGIVS